MTLKKLSFFKTVGHGLNPMDKQTADYIEGLLEGEGIELTKPVKIRSYRFHRRFFAMLKYSFDNLNESFDFKTIDAFRKSVIISAGYYEPVQIFIDGQIYETRQAKSMSFARMDEQEFRTLYNAVHIVLMKMYGFSNDEYFVTNYL